MLCPSCQKMIPDGVRYCPYCGGSTNTVSEGPALFNDNEDFLSGSVPRYEDSGAIPEEPASEPAPSSEDRTVYGMPDDQALYETPDKQAVYDTPEEEAIYDMPDDKTLYGMPGDVSADSSGEPAPTADVFTPEPDRIITSMSGEQYNARDARYSQDVELSGLNLLTPTESGDDAANRKTALIALGIFGVLAAITLGVAVWVISSGLGSLAAPGYGSGDGLWGFLTRPQPSYAGYDTSEPDWESEDWWAEDGDDEWDEWNDDNFWDDETGDDDNSQAFSYDQIPVQTPEMTSLEYTDYLAGYKAPEELGDDLYSGNVRLEGDLYHMPIPISELVKNGWEITQLEGENIETGADTVIGASEYSFISLKKGDKELNYLTVRNPYREERPLKDIVLIDLHCDDSVAVDLPGLPADADAAQTGAFLEQYNFTEEAEESYSAYYLLFSPSGNYEQNYDRNWLTLYDFNKNGEIDSLSLDYDYPFTR